MGSRPENVRCDETLLQDGPLYRVTMPNRTMPRRDIEIICAMIQANNDYEEMREFRAEWPDSTPTTLPVPRPPRP